MSSWTVLHLFWSIGQKGCVTVVHYLVLSYDFEKNKCKLWTLQPDTATTEPGTYCPAFAMFTKDDFPEIPMTFQYPALSNMLPELGNPIKSDCNEKHKHCISKEQKVCFSW
ncbi:unnamed protein product [Leuciscus chuanchicus]